MRFNSALARNVRGRNKRARLISLALAAAATLGVAIFGQGRPAAFPDRRGASDAPAAAVAATHLPACLGDAFQIDLLSAIHAIPDDTLEVQREQLRDWIWSVTLGRVAAATSVENVFSGVADVPLVRDDSLAHALRMPSGPTRATTTTRGDVVVLVDAAGTTALMPAVLEAVDEEASALGRTPERADVYGYEFEPAVATARVCRIATLDRATLESADHGYRTATITSPAALGHFLSSGADLLRAQCTPAGLEVSGRQRERVRRAPPTAEDVAALAQRLGGGFVPPARFGTKLADRPPDERLRIGRLARLLGSEPAAELRAKLALSFELDPAAQRAAETILAWRDLNPKTPLADLVLSYQLQMSADGNPGFSLDPVYSVATAKRNLDEVIRATSDTASLERLLSGWGDALDAKSLQEAPLDSASLRTVKHRLEITRARLAKSNDSDVPTILWSEQPATELKQVAEVLLRTTASQSGRQCARYDGPFAGTSVGMTFFYTDLSMKFFARDWNGGSPEGTIDGFESVVHHSGSSAWCNEESRNATRVWLGLRSEGYSRERDGSVRFAPTTTRLFAKGSNQGSHEAESDPPAYYRRFIRWWDSHYGVMAEWEPQYETLNQLMKWSVVVQSARIAQQPACLAFLDDVPIERDQRLNRWAEQHGELRWRAAVQQVGVTKGDKECLPLLGSEPFRQCGGIMSLSGGVSAGGFEEVRSKPLRSVATPLGLRHLAPDAGPVNAGAGKVRFERIARSGGGELSAVEVETGAGRLRFSANIDRRSPQVGNLGWTDPTAPIRETAKTIEGDNKGLHIAQVDNGLGPASLRAYDLDLGTVRLAVDTGPVQQAKTLGRTVARRLHRDGVSLHDAGGALAAEHEVFALGGDEIAVHVDDGTTGGTKSYLVMTAGGGKRGPPPEARGGFVIGSPEGGPYSKSGPPNGQHPPIHVWMLDETHGRRYVSDNRGRRIDLPPDLTRLAVKERLAARDVSGALAAFEQKPTVPAAGLILAAALDRGDFAAAERAIAGGGKTAAPDDLSLLQTTLDDYRVAAARRGQNPRQAGRLSMLLAIEQRQRLMPDPDEAAAVPALATRVVAPPTYAIEASLPPPIHPSGQPLKPAEQYVSRVIDMPIDVQPGSRVKLSADEEYDVRAWQAGGNGAPGADPRSRARDRVGPSARLLGYSVPAALVVPCSDSDRSRPDCRAKDGAAERALLQFFELCDLDGDQQWTSAAELSCLQALTACLDGAPSSTPASEEACVQAARAKYRPSASKR